MDRGPHCGKGHCEELVAELFLFLLGYVVRELVRNAVMIPKFQGMAVHTLRDATLVASEISVWYLYRAIVCRNRDRKKK